MLDHEDREPQIQESQLTIWQNSDDRESQPFRKRDAKGTDTCLCTHLSLSTKNMADCDINGLLNAQLPNANQGERGCRSLADTNLAADIIRAQNEMMLIDNANAIIGMLAVVRETTNSDTIVANLMSQAHMALSAEGGPCAYTHAELQAFLAKGSDKKYTVCASEKMLNRGNTDILTVESQKANLALLRELINDILKSIMKLHKPGSKFKPHGVNVDESQIKKLRMKSFNSLRSTKTFAAAVSMGMSHITAGGYVPRVLVVPETAIPQIDTGDLVGMSAEFVGDDGFLARTGSVDNMTHTYGQLTIVKTPGDKNDPMVGEARVPEHHCNGGSACDSGNRTIKIQDYSTGQHVSVDLEEAVDALRIFEDNEISGTVKSVVTQQRTKSKTPWSTKYCVEAAHNPYNLGANMGIWTYRDASGRIQVSHRFGDFPMSRSVQEGFAKSIVDKVGSDVVPMMKRLEGILKKINRQAPAQATYFNLFAAANANGELEPAFGDEAGARRVARGNAWGVLNHPAIGTPPAGGPPAVVPAAALTSAQFQAGYAFGAGLKYLAENAQSFPAQFRPVYQEIAQVVDVAERLGEELASVLPDWESGPRPSYFQGTEYTAGMRLIDSLIAGGANLIRVTDPGDAQVLVFTEPGQADYADYIAVAANSAEGFLQRVAADLAAQNYVDSDDNAVTGNNGRRSASGIQGFLVDLINDRPDLREPALELLNEVAALAGVGGRFANVASFDIRAALVFQRQNDANQVEILEVLRKLLGAWQDGPASTVEMSMSGMPTEYADGTRRLVRKVAAAIAQGRTPWGLTGDALGEWYSNIGLDEAGAVGILETQPIVALAGGDDEEARDTILPLVIGGNTLAQAATVLPPGLRYTDPNNPNARAGAGGNAAAALPAANVNANQLYAGQTIGAQFGAGSSRSTAGGQAQPVAAQLSADNDHPTLQDNKSVARKLKSAYKAIVLSLINARLTANNFRGLVGCGDVDYPFAFLLVRSAHFGRVEHGIISQGSAVNEIVHEPLRVRQLITECAEWYKATVVVTSTGVQKEPGANTFLPAIRVDDVISHTADVSFIGQDGHGAIIPIVVPRDSRCPDVLNIRGIDEHGNLTLPSAPIVHALFKSEISAMFNKELALYDECESYHGQQITYDCRGGERVVSAKGADCTVY